MSRDVYYERLCSLFLSFISVISFLATHRPGWFPLHLPTCLLFAASLFDGPRSSVLVGTWAAINKKGIAACSLWLIAPFLLLLISIILTSVWHRVNTNIAIILSPPIYLSSSIITCRLSVLGSSRWYISPPIRTTNRFLLLIPI